MEAGKKTNPKHFSNDVLFAAMLSVKIMSAGPGYNSKWLEEENMQAMQAWKAGTEAWNLCTKCAKWGHCIERIVEKEMTQRTSAHNMWAHIHGYSCGQSIMRLGLLKLWLILHLQVTVCEWFFNKCMACMCSIFWTSHSYAWAALVFIATTRGA